MFPLKVETSWRKGMQTQVGSDLSYNKRLAKECLDMSFNQHKPAQAVAQYIGADYRQHNPNALDGPQGILAYASGYIKANPELHMDFKRIIAEGDLVAVHSHLKPTPSDRGLAVVDIFRVEDRKLVEHWDVIQPVPAQATNKNGMF
jgi:predicted SnoaL-like aldol condensation-catalyzing enzyme